MKKKNYLSNSRTSINEIVEMTSALLKHDWDRVKSNQNFLESPYFYERIINLLILLSGVLFAFIYLTPKLNLDSQYIDYILEMDLGFILIIFILIITIKIAFRILISSFFFRNKWKNNVNIYSQTYKEKIEKFMKKDLK